MEDAFRCVEKYGYGGVELHTTKQKGRSTARTVVPKQCPFCLHDSSLSADERIGHLQFHVNGGGPMGIPVDQHVNAVGDGEAFCPCSAAGGADRPLCRSDGKMTAESLRTHLLIVYGVGTKARSKVRKKGTGTGGIDDLVITDEGQDAWARVGIKRSVNRLGGLMHLR